MYQCPHTLLLWLWFWMCWPCPYLKAPSTLVLVTPHFSCEPQFFSLNKIIPIRMKISYFLFYKQQQKNMRAGCFFFFQSQDTKALLIWKRLNPPNLILSSFNKYFNVNDGDQGILSHIRKRPQEEGVILSWNKKMMSSCPATDPGYRTARELTAPKANRAEDSSMCSGKHQITSYHDLQQKQGWGSRAGCEIG